MGCQALIGFKGDKSCLGTLDSELYEVKGQDEGHNSSEARACQGGSPHRYYQVSYEIHTPQFRRYVNIKKLRHRCRPARYLQLGCQD